LGEPAVKGRAPDDDDELLELVAFDLSVARQEYGQEPSLTEVITRLVENHPNYSSLAQRESKVRNLQRKFSRHEAAYMSAHSYDSTSGIPDPYAVAVDILRLFEAAGVAVDFRRQPKPVTSKGRGTD
jgi:hypothetical protein